MSLPSFPRSCKWADTIRAYYQNFVLHDIVRMGNTRIPKKVLNRKFRGRPVKRTLLRWEDVRRDSFDVEYIYGFVRWWSADKVDDVTALPCRTQDGRYALL